MAGSIRRCPPIELERQRSRLRAMAGSFIETALGRLIVHEADVAPGRPGDAPGRLVEDERRSRAHDRRWAPATPSVQLAGRRADGRRVGPPRCARARRADGRAALASWPWTWPSPPPSCSGPDCPACPRSSGRVAGRAWPAGLPRPTGRRRACGAARSTRSRPRWTLPADLRAELATSFRFDTVADTELRVTDGGLTEKALHRLADGALDRIGPDALPGRRGSARERHTLCISSQAGCAVGCPFCATGELGFGRDLEIAEIVDQVRWARRAGCSSMAGG